MSASLSPDLLERLTSFRRDLHRRPEISGAEEMTAAAVAGLLAEFAPAQILEGLGGHGVAVVFDSGSDGPTVMIRAELDGLPIVETGTMVWRSLFPGRGHLCGHDGHTTILAALASMLAGAPPRRGRVVLMFQPAEETGAGAAAVIADPRFSDIAPDYAFALHNLPGLPLGAAAIRAGPFNFASEGLSIELGGRTAHASMPEQGLSPAQAMAKLMDALPNLPATLGRDAGSALATLVHARLGEPAFGIAPGYARVMATLRAIDDPTQAELMAAAEALARQTAKRHGLDLKMHRAEAFAACHNDAEATTIVEAAIAEAAIDGAPIDAPYRWSEDFGRFGQHCKAAMFVLGAGEDCPPLHAPDYDFPDALIAPGAAIFERIVRRLCG